MLAKDFKRHLIFFVENLENLFISDKKKEIKRIGEKGKDIKPKIISYKLEFIASTRFMGSTLSNLFDNFAKEFIKLNVNMDKITQIFKITKLSEKIVSAT